MVLGPQPRVMAPPAPRGLLLNQVPGSYHNSGTAVVHIGGAEVCKRGHGETLGVEDIKMLETTKVGLLDRWIAAALLINIGYFNHISAKIGVA